MIAYLGWIAAAFLAGFILAAWLKDRTPSLRQRMTRIPVYRGKTYAEILREVAAEPQTAKQRIDGTTLRTWNDRDGYTISLAFDSADVCLGVESEG